MAMASAALAGSASSNTTTGALPPSSRWTRLRPAAAAAATSLPARTLPVMETICGTGWVTSLRPVSRSPQMTLNTPGGRNWLMISAISSVEAGVVSDGFSTIVFPAASAGAHFQVAIIIG
jgi:hypothetical protein